MADQLFKKIFAFMFYGICMVSFSQKEKHIRMIYQETVCPPSWISYNNNKATLKNLKELLNKDSIEVFSLKIIGKNNKLTCEGCQCLTGRNIEVTIKERDREKLIALRFKLQTPQHLN